MKTARECYQMAEKCERQAIVVKSDRARKTLTEVAAQWRKLVSESHLEQTLCLSRGYASSMGNEIALSSAELAATRSALWLAALSVSPGGSAEACPGPPKSSR
jgi:hypothetical protein